MHSVINSLNMKMLLIGLAIWVSPFLSFGHNPLSARYHLEAGEHASLLTVNLSQEGVNYALLAKYSKAEIAELSQNAWEEIIVDYIKRNFHLSIDGKEITLKKGGIKLGSHQTDLKFVLPPLSSEIRKIDIDIPAFKENDQHQTIFSYGIYQKLGHEILRDENQYRSIITLQKAAVPTWVWFVLIAIVGFVAFLRFK